MSDPLAAAEALNRKCKEAFKKYDLDGNGTLERNELTQALEDLGLLKGVDKPSIGSFVIDMFGRLDKNGDQHLQFEEFAELYNSVVREKELMSKGTAYGVGSDLHEVFITFANFGKTSRKEEMDGKNWAKFCKDSKVADKKMFTMTDVDMTFAKVKPKGGRLINFQEFSRGLNIAAEKKGLDYDTLVGRVCNAGGPEVKATRADSVKFHDDKSMYTGMHKGK
ncbi:p25-alpha-domain-containing protein [Pycnococcus provasolii]